MRAAAALVRLTRPGNAAVAALAVWVGALTSGLAVGALPPALAWGAISALAFAAAGNVRNDIADVEVDRRAHPARPLVAGEASPAAARALAVGLYVVAALAALLVGPYALLLVLVALPVMESYERRWKARGLPGNLAIGALTGAPFVMGALVVAASSGAPLGAAAWAVPTVRPGVLSLALLAGLATVGREVLKDIEDIDADIGARTTLPMRIGAARASLVAAAFLVAAVALSPLPWALEKVIAWPYLPAVGAADACFLAAAAVGRSHPPRAQRLAKAGMLVALAALVIGRLSGSVSP